MSSGQGRGQTGTGTGQTTEEQEWPEDRRVPEERAHYEEPDVHRGNEDQNAGEPFDKEKRFPCQAQVPRVDVLDAADIFSAGGPRARDRRLGSLLRPRCEQ
jgi:hypothetical protein